MGRGAERAIERALGALRRALDRTRAPWMVIGGIAVVARGVARMTTDIDVLVRHDAITVDELVAALAREKIVPRIPGAAAFARTNLVLLARHAPTGVELDVCLALSDFELEALEERSVVAYGRAEAPTASPASLVVLKALAARPVDLLDVEALLVVHPNIDLARVRRRVAELAAILDAPEVLIGLDPLLARVRAARRGRR